MTQKTIEPSKRTSYDAIIVGSGAAGGMTAFQLSRAGLRVLILEAGRDVDMYKEPQTMEWPYKTPQRAQLLGNEHALNAAEYNMLDRPYGMAKAVASYPHLYSYSGNHFTRGWVADEKENPFTGTPYAWVRLRALGGKTLIWGRVALRLSDYDFKNKTHDGHGEDWPIAYSDIAPYYDKVDTLLGITGTAEHLPQLPDSIYQRPVKMTCGEQMFRRTVAKMGRTLIPGRAGVTTDGVLHNRYRSRCMGRGRCGRGCDLSAAFHSPTALIYPAKDTGLCDVRTDSVVAEVLLDAKTNRARGVRVIDRKTKAEYEFTARVVILAASTVESTRLLFNSRSAEYPNGLANSSGVLGHYFCEHVMGPKVTGFMPSLVGKEATLDDGRPQSTYLPRFRNVTERHPDFVRGYGYQGFVGAVEYPGFAAQLPGFGAGLKQNVRNRYPAFASYSGFGEVVARYENEVGVDPTTTDRWGIPVARFNYRFGENERAMVKDMAEQGEEMLRAAGCTDITITRDALPEGWSIHELGTARMGDDPKTSVTNSFGQTHDVKNLFVLDGSIFVSSSCQNPTWTILALAWRGSEYLAGEMKRENL